MRYALSINYWKDGAPHHERVLVTDPASNGYAERKAIVATLGFEPRMWMTTTEPPERIPTLSDWMRDKRCATTNRIAPEPYVHQQLEE